MVYGCSKKANSSSHFEVDSTESVWYKQERDWPTRWEILKLTPQSQYGIRVDPGNAVVHQF